MKSVKYWKTKNGIKIPIKEMTDSHIQNSIAMMIRMAPTSMENELFLAFSAAASFDSDSMASYYADNECFSMQNEHIEDYLDRQPIFKALCNEAKKRKIPYQQPC